MRHYQQLLLAALEQHGWQLDEVQHPEPWWAAELWTLSSIRQRHGFRVFCTFLVDPQSHTFRELSAVRSIAFTAELPDNWLQAEDAPAVLYPADRAFPMQLEPAMARLEQLRSDAAGMS